MAGTQIFLLVSSLLQGALCGAFNIKMPQNINVLRESCVTIPCSFDVESTFENKLDDTCKAYWNDSPSFSSGNVKLIATDYMTGDLTKKDCTTTFNNTNLLRISKYYFRLECNNALKYTFTQTGVDISFIDVPPSLTLTPSTLEVKEGTSVSLTCSAPAPCWSHPPALTWSPNLGQSQETLQENQDKTKVKTSVVSFTASHLHHGNKISCTAVCQKQDGSPDITAETSLIPVISFSPKDFKISVSPSGPVPENSNVTLTCSSNANPAVESYTWYTADGDNFMETGQTLNVAVSTINSIFFCKATNTLGFERSSNLQVDVQYSPKNITLSVSPSGPVPENSNVILTCSSNANPAVRNYTWFMGDGDQDTFIGTGTSLNIEVSRDRQTFFCNAENEIGVGRSSSIRIDVQYSVLYPVIISALTALLLVLICVVLFFIRLFFRAQKNPCKPKSQLPDESNTVATSQPITLEENEAPNATEDSIYANTDWLKVPENIHHATIAGPSNTNLPNFRANNEEGETENTEKEDSCHAIYSNVNRKTKSKKKKNSRDSSHLEEKCILRGISRNYVSNALEMGGL